MQHSEKFMQTVQDIKSQIKQIDIHTVKQKMNNKTFHLIDVRETHEWANGHLPNAIHLSKGTIEQNIGKIIPDFNAEIILYCGGGTRSTLAADTLQKMGYHNVFSMNGGFRAWQGADFVIEN